MRIDADGGHHLGSTRVENGIGEGRGEAVEVEAEGCGWVWVVELELKLVEGAVDDVAAAEGSTNDDHPRKARHQVEGMRVH